MAFLVARPNIKAQQCCEALRTANLRAYAAPIMDVDINTDAALSLRLSVACPQIIIVTSTYAAQWFCTQSFDSAHETLRVVCIGRSTAAIITRVYAAIQVDIAQPENSEGTLRLPVLQDVKDKRILILKGEGGRNMLNTSLQKKGGIVDTFDVYRRTQNKNFVYPSALILAELQCMIATSVELVALSLKIFDRSWAIKLHWIVASERIKDYAVSQGISRITISDGANNDAIVSCAQKLVSTGAVNV